MTCSSKYRFSITLQTTKMSMNTKANFVILLLKVGTNKIKRSLTFAIKLQHTMRISHFDFRQKKDQLFTEEG